MKNFAEPPDPLIGACLGAAAAIAAAGPPAETTTVAVDASARALYRAATADPWERGDDARAVKP